MQTSYDTTSTTGETGHARREGKVARALEKQTAKIPSDVFLWGAVAALGASATMQILSTVKQSRMGMRTFMGGGVGRNAPWSTFIGQWVPTLLLLGVYNKIVKVMGSDRAERERDLYGR